MLFPPWESYFTSFIPEGDRPWKWHPEASVSEVQGPEPRGFKLPGLSHIQQVARPQPGSKTSFLKTPAHASARQHTMLTFPNQILLLWYAGTEKMGTQGGKEERRIKENSILAPHPT